MLLTADDIRQLNDKIQYQSAFIDRLRDETARVIIGQHHMLDRLLIGLVEQWARFAGRGSGVGENAYH